MDWYRDVQEVEDNGMKEVDSWGEEIFDKLFNMFILLINYVAIKSKVIHVTYAK